MEVSHPQLNTILRRDHTKMRIYQRVYWHGGPSLWPGNEGESEGWCRATTRRCLGEDLCFTQQACQPTKRWRL